MGSPGRQSTDVGNRSQSRLRRGEGTHFCARAPRTSASKKWTALSGFCAMVLRTRSSPRIERQELRFDASVVFVTVLLVALIGKAQPTNGIGAPSYYWKDGEWKPYSSSVQPGKASPPNANGVFGQHDMGIGQRTIGIGQPAGGIGQPNTGLGQTTIGLGQPTIGIGQQAGGIGSPNTGIGQNTIGIGRPAGGIGQPTIGLGQPNTGLGQPTIGIGQQMNSTNRRAAVPRGTGQSTNWQGRAHYWHPGSLSRTNRVAGQKQIQPK